MVINLINFFGLTLLAFIVLFSKRAVSGNKNYAVFTLLAALVCLTRFAAEFTASSRGAYFLTQVGLATLIFVSAVFFQFVLNVVDDEESKDKYLTAAYIISLLFFILNLTPYFLKGVSKTDRLCILLPGPLFHSFTVYVAILGVLLFLIINRSIKKSSHTQRYRFVSLRIALIVSGIIFFLHIYAWLGARIATYSTYAVIPLFFWFAYVSVLYESLALGSIIRKAVISISMAFIFSGIFMVLILIMESMLRSTLDYRLLYPAVLTGLIIVMAYVPLKNHLTLMITKLFFRKRFEGEKVSKDLSRQILSILKKEEIYNYILSSAGFLLNCEKLAIFAWDSEAQKFSLHAAAGIDKNKLLDFSFTNNSFFIKHLLHTKLNVSWKSIVTDYRKIKIREELEPLAQEGLTYFVPFISREDILIILAMGRSERDTVFTDEDRELLAGLIANGTMAIEKIQLMEINEKLKELDEMKQDFISNVTHELKSPLTAIQSCVEFLLKKKGGNLTRVQMDYLVMVQNNSVRLTRFISQLLDISRIEAARLDLFKEEVSIPNLAQEIALLFGPYADEKGIKIRVFAQPDVMEVMADQDKIKQVFTNIISNALKFTDQGEITIRITDRPECVETVIADTGIGIPKDEVGKLFDKFYQVKETHKMKKYGGTGLGLAIVKGIVEAHTGRIWVESEIGKGTKFTLTLPKETWD